MTTEAFLRTITHAEIVYAAIDDVAALLLDAAAALEQQPGITATAALRSLADGMARR